MLICKGADNSIRWKPGERLDHVFEARCDELDAASGGTHPAVITDEKTYTFRELDNLANQAARHLKARGVKPGDKVGLLFDKGVSTYIALLAVLKVNAAYVPFDGGFPNDRIEFILEDAGVTALLTQEMFREKASGFEVPVIFLDSEHEAIAKLDSARLSAEEKGAPKDEIAYLIYTSGTTGKPKGVVIEHASICNFVRVAAEIYGYGPQDRVYQGMTIAFDFSVEELWVPLLAGAALVPAKAAATLVGGDLADYLLEHKVTGWACVPTLLATIEKDLPDLRLLIVSGEACPQNLVTRWARDGRKILNAYGPTEATVTCTLTELLPDKPVTIGGPLPTYTIVILDPDKREEISAGGMGEIGIAGVGLAQGYLNRPDLTEQKFIPDFIGLPNNPSKRIYRSGDLGCINADGEVEFHGRIDTQVKIRGYRIELTEIESVLMEFPEIAQAVVDTHEAEPGAVELVAYYAPKKGEKDLDHNAVAQVLRKRLPRYMVPAYIEKLPIIPMTPSDKADRKALPPPKGARVAGGSGNFVAPSSGMEKLLASTLAEIMQVDKLSIEDHFFNDLGAHSLLMARFCARLREIPGAPDISMPAIYQNTSIAALAAHFESAESVEETAPPVRRDPLRIPSNLEYYGCGVLQAATAIGYMLFGLWILQTAFYWTYAVEESPAALYFRVVAFSVSAFLAYSLLPVAVKWLLIGRWKAERIPIWSLRYYRFWLVKTLIRTSPLAAFAGTPIFNVYMRLLGARIGKDVVISSAQIPVCADLLAIGDNTILRKDSILTGYRAQSNYIYTGPVSIGANCFVGEGSVVDVDTVMEDDTQLGHASSLQSGQRLQRGKRYHGSPAVETPANYCTLDPMPCSGLRKGVWCAFLLAGVLGLLLPVAIFLLYEVAPYFFRYTEVVIFDPASPWNYLFPLAIETAVVVFAAMVLGLALGLAGVFLLPRLGNAFLTPEKTYVRYGFHYFMNGLVSGASNSRLYNLLFGDSPFITWYLSRLGYDLNEIDQTGSNFGTNQKQDNPFLCDIGSGTMVSDGLSMINAQMSPTSFRLSKVRIGDHNYLGNVIFFPSDGRTGENVLLGTKVMIPVDGKLRENVGLLGSPCFEIPRAVDRDTEYGQFTDAGVRAARISKKARHNLLTVILYLLSYWLFAVVSILTGVAAVLYFPTYGLMSFVLGGLGLSVFSVAYFVLLERASLGFRRLQPQMAAVYEDYFWFHERHWKFTEFPLQRLFVGTPFKPFISRLLGIRMGSKVFDDGAQFLEKTLVSVGDYTNLNVASVVQGHSLEEGIFKSDRIDIGKGCSIGTGAFVHYGTTLRDDALLAPDSFLMKGEVLERGSTWRGNPARAIRDRHTSVDDIQILAAAK